VRFVLYFLWLVAAHAFITWFTIRGAERGSFAAILRWCALWIPPMLLFNSAYMYVWSKMASFGGLWFARFAQAFGSAIGTMSVILILGGTPRKGTLVAVVLYFIGVVLSVTWR